MQYTFFALCMLLSPLAFCENENTEDYPPAHFPEDFTENTDTEFGATYRGGVLERNRDWAEEVWQALERKRGKIRLIKGIASLIVPQGFFYLDTQDSQALMVEIWGMPPGAPSLGTLVPENLTPFDENFWSIDINYRQEGHVLAKQLKTLDASQLRDMIAQNAARAGEKYGDSIQLVDWVQVPKYLQDTQQLYWATELKFGDASDHALSHGIRVLGKDGILMLDTITALTAKDQLQSHIPNLLDAAYFEPGSRHQDYQPTSDRISKTEVVAVIPTEGTPESVRDRSVWRSPFIWGLVVFVVIGVAIFFRRLGKHKTY